MAVNCDIDNFIIVSTDCSFKFYDFNSEFKKKINDFQNLNSEDTLPKPLEIMTPFFQTSEPHKFFNSFIDSCEFWGKILKS